MNIGFHRRTHHDAASSGAHLSSFRTDTRESALADVCRHLGLDRRHATGSSTSVWSRGGEDADISVLGATHAYPLDAGIDITQFDSPPKQIDEVPAPSSDSLAHSTNTSDRHDRLDPLIHELVAHGVTAAFAERLVDQLPAAAGATMHEVRARLVELLAAEIRVTGPIQASSARQVIAFVGPTGVGKTTTIAKLAADLRLREELSVGLITVDTYRVAAVEQLQTYAEIIDLPLEVVSSYREMRDALMRLNACDVILLDTAGCSPHDTDQMNHLQSFLQAAKPDSIQLVLSASSASDALFHASEAFGQLGANSIVLAKLDETKVLGHLIPLFSGSQLPLSYVSMGQSVPDDLRPADPYDLAHLISPTEFEETS